MFRRVRTSAFALTALLVFFGGSAARAAAPLEDHVPQDAIIYFGWAGSDALQAQYANSNLKGVVEASSARAFIAQHLPQLIDQAGRNDPNAPKVIADIQTCLGIAWRHPSAFYFCPVDLTNVQQPEFRFGLLCDAGAEAKTLADLLNGALAGAPPQKELPINVTVDANLVGITFGKPQTAAEREKFGTLAAAPAYINAMTELKNPKPAFATYMDMTRGLALFNDVIAKIPNMPPDARTKVTTLVDLLGVSGMTQMAAASGFDGKEWVSQSFMGLTGTRKGIVAMAGKNPLSDAALSVVPKDAVSFSAIKFDPHQEYQELRNILGQVDPNIVQMIDSTLTQARSQFDLDLDQDILAPLGDEWVFYRAPLSDIGGNTFAVVHKLRDGDRFAKTLATAEALAGKAANGIFKVEHTSESKIDFSTIAYSSYSVAWTVRNGYLYVSSLEGIVGAVKQVESKKPNITESDIYKKAIAFAPPGIKPVTISYANPAKVYPELRRMAIGLLPIARAAGLDLPADLLPDSETVMPFMTPGASISWSDDAGIHMSGRSAFPGAALIGGNSDGTTGIAAAALSTAVVLPALGRARESAKRVVDATALKSIGMGIAIYTAQNNQMPDDVARIAIEGTALPAKDFVRTLAGARAGLPPLEWTPDIEKLS
ncbi:MAG TPA: hypothetical protein VGN88_13850, partial [Phycisphaerae bacterium]